MVHIGLIDDFRRQILLWDSTSVPMKDPSGLLGKIYLTILKMHEVVMQTAEPVSTKRRY